MPLRRTTVAAAALLAIGGTLAVAPAADAAALAGLIPSTFVTSYDTKDVPALGVATATASCPPGTLAISTGGLYGGGLSGVTPGPGYDTGTATGRAGASDIGTFVVAEVTCAPAAQLSGTTIVSRDQRAHSSVGEWTQIVTCPAGMRAFGGGGYFRDKNGARGKDSYFLSADTLTKDQRSWRVSARDDTFTDTLVVTTRCAPQSHTTVFAEQEFPIVPVRGESGGRVSGYARCPDGFTAITGGAEVTGDSPAAGAQPKVTASVSVESGQIGWFGAGESRGDNPKLHVVVLCGA